MKNQILVHICCSVDSHFFLQELQNLHPNDEIISFFYDPNIHPFSEYQLRLLDVKRSCKILGIKLIEGNYNYEQWISAVRGLEDEPEKGARCQVCFDNRLLETAKEAKKRGFKFFTTTLLTSPKKSIEQLKIAGDLIGQKYHINFLTYDFRVGGGTNRQFAMAKEAKVYHQDYCGCFFALTKQREGQERLARVTGRDHRSFPTSGGSEYARNSRNRGESPAKTSIRQRLRQIRHACCFFGGKILQDFWLGAISIAIRVIKLGKERDRWKEYASGLPITCPLAHSCSG